MGRRRQVGCPANAELGGIVEKRIAESAVLASSHLPSITIHGLLNLPSPAACHPVHGALGPWTLDLGPP
jgi:hypothetical protein